MLTEERGRRALNTFVTRFCAGAVLALSACGGGQSGTTLSDPRPIGAEPLAAFARLAAADERALNEATDRMFRSCMLEAGFTIPQFPAPTFPDGGRENPFTFTLTEAEQNGYAFDTGVDTENLQTWFTTLDQPTQTAFFEAAFGPEPDGTLPVIDAANPGDVRDVLPARLGCDGQASDAIVGDSTAYESVRLQLQAAYIGSAELALSDPRLDDETKLWAGCMAELGYDYRVPRDARTDALDRPPADQQTIAEADAKCRESSAYNDAGIQLMWAHQQDWIDANPGVLDEYEALRQSALARASAALETPTK